MAALTFPTNPTDGQVFSAGERAWSWNSAIPAWEESSRTYRTGGVTAIYPITGTAYYALVAAGTTSATTLYLVDTNL